MTRDEAEQIYMAVEVGMFHGTRAEYAMALIVLAGDEQPTPPANPGKEAGR